jgi:hypothetical protein
VINVSGNGSFGNHKGLLENERVVTTLRRREREDLSTENDEELPTENVEAKLPNDSQQRREGDAKLQPEKIEAKLPNDSSRQCEGDAELQRGKSNQGSERSTPRLSVSTRSPTSKQFARDVAGVPSDVRGEQRPEILELVDSISLRRLPSGPMSVSRRRSAIV